MIKLTTPLTPQKLAKLKTGDSVLLSGVIFTARDAAHKKLLQEKAFPEFLKGQVIYYAGPTPTPPGKASGSIGPTTSGRMDKYVSFMVEEGEIPAFIGKGFRSEDAKKAMLGRAVYFAALGGAGALMAGRVKKSEVALYKELGAEAVRRLEVKDMPLIVAFDFKGKDIYGE